MKSQRSDVGGYTIIETLIFLGVTAFLFVAAAALINGQQAKTEFAQGVRDFESQLQDIANDVSTGYYANNNTFSCSDDGTGTRPTITNPTGTTQGSNGGCIFVGKVAQFYPSDKNASTYRLLTVAGKQRTRVGTFNKEVQTLTEAAPTAIEAGATINQAPFPSASSDVNISGGITVAWVRYDTNGSASNISGFGIFTTFGQSPSNNLQSGTVSADIVAIGGDINKASTTIVDNIDNVGSLPANSPLINPPKGIRICLESGGNSQYAVLTLGGTNRKVSTKLDFYNNGKCSNIS